MDDFSSSYSKKGFLFLSKSLFGNKKEKPITGIGIVVKMKFHGKYNGFMLIESYNFLKMLILYHFDFIEINVNLLT